MTNSGKMLRLAFSGKSLYIEMQQALCIPAKSRRIELRSGEQRKSLMILVIEEKELRRLPITIDSEIVSGTPVFQGTRVPVDALLNNLEAGLTLEEFLDNFPTVSREQALQILAFCKTTLKRLGKTS
jgi:uncharacterized protein (DUF433 family)